MSTLTGNPLSHKITPWAELKPWLQLFHIKGLGANTFQQLIAHFGSPNCILLDACQLGTDIPKSIAHAIKHSHACPQVQKAIEKDYQWLSQSSDHHIICPASTDYPPLLSHIAIPPSILYLKGNREFLKKPVALAIVGSRSATHSGLETAQHFAAELAHQGILIVSGMARGIDGAAHHGALSVAGATAAVLGTGINCVYPKAHLRLAKQIAEQGLLISEFALDTPPRAGHFPRRNRIISGLCSATIVVEADIKSGSLITAKLALEQGRDVMAIPGSIYNLRAKGCHELIRQGAALVECVDHILQELQHPIKIQPSINSSASINSTPVMPELEADILTAKIVPSENQNHILSQLSVSSKLTEEAWQLLQHIDFDVTHHDDLVLRSGLNSAQIAALVCELECNGLIKTAPGGFVRQHQLS